MTVGVAAEPSICLRSLDGSMFEHGANWGGPVGPEEAPLLRQIRGPVLDVGCGPGRHVATLASWGVPALGIDIAPVAVDAARGRGASALRRSVFDRIPGAGRWASALLLDGNVGIGGDPAALLARVASLLRPAGPILVEIAAPETPIRNLPVYLALAGQRGPHFDWTTVGVDRLPVVAARANLHVAHEWNAGGRWFATLYGGQQ